MNEKFDLVIIGGGLAGLASAVNIQEGNVLLLEKNKITTEETTFTRFVYADSMKRFGLSNCILKKYDILRLLSVDGSVFDFQFDKKVMSLLDFGKILKTMKKDVEIKHEIREKNKVLDIQKNNRRLELKISNGSESYLVSSKFVIDASGHYFFSRDKFNLKKPDLYCPSLSSIFKGDFKIDSEMISFIIPTDDFKGGGWIYPLNDKNCVLGIADTSENAFSPLTLEKKLLKLQNNHVIGNNIVKTSEKKWDMGIIATGISYPLVYDQIVFIGDIIGQGIPWNMNGVRPILECSILCANAVNNAIKCDEKKKLNEYQDTWISTYGSVFKDYDYHYKWTKNSNEWKKTSIKKMEELYRRDKKLLLDNLRYYSMEKNKKDYLKKLSFNSKIERCQKAIQ